jgi:hypothetical protein
MAANGMVRLCSGPASKGSWHGRLMPAKYVRPALSLVLASPA